MDTPAFPGATEITPLSLMEMWEFSFYSRAPMHLPSLVLCPSPISPMALAGANQACRIRRTVSTAQYFQGVSLLGVSSDLYFSLHAFQGVCCYTCKLMQKDKEHLLWRKTKAVTHTDVPESRLREHARAQVQHSDPQNLAEWVQSLTSASVWPKSSPRP